MTTLALVGIGNWGKNYLRTIKDIPQCRIKYIIAKDFSHAQLLGNEYVSVDDFRQLASFPDINGIIIATPSSTHYEITRFFLEKNYHLLIEKPLTTNYQNAVTLQKIYERKENIIMVGHIYLHHPAFIKLVSLIPSLGELHHIKFESGAFGPFRKDATALWDWGPHDVAMCLTLLRENPVGVSAWGTDMVNLRLDFSERSPVFISTGRVLPEKKRECIIVGSNGTIVFDDTAERKLILYKKCVKSYPQYPNEEPLKRQLEAFVDAIEKKQRQTQDFYLGVRVVKVLHAAERSLTNNGKITKIKY